MYFGTFRTWDFENKGFIAIIAKRDMWSWTYSQGDRSSQGDGGHQIDRGLGLDCLALEHYSRPGTNLSTSQKIDEEILPYLAKSSEASSLFVNVNGITCQNPSPWI